MRRSAQALPGAVLHHSARQRVGADDAVVVEVALADDVAEPQRRAAAAVDVLGGRRPGTDAQHECESVFGGLRYEGRFGELYFRLDDLAEAVGSIAGAAANPRPSGHEQHGIHLVIGIGRDASETSGCRFAIGIFYGGADKGSENHISTGPDGDAVFV